MPQPRPSIADLLAEGRLQRISADVEEARDLRTHAEAHRHSSRAISDLDPEGAYQLLYDAARKAVAADMLVEGFRARSDRPGAHTTVVAYAEEALCGAADAESNTATRNQLAADLAHAEEIVRAVRLRIGGA
jgi:hypothetical protein